jgi:hypothetical protein
LGRTIDEVEYIYDQAKNLMDEREKDYEGSWRDEGLGCAVGACYKKASQLKVMFNNGRYKENISRTKEDLLDQINYAVLTYRLIELEEEESR